MTLRTCTLCKRETTWRPVNFLADGRLWRVEIPLCIHPDCLEKRGATSVENKVLATDA